jgi:hypothetical protein
MLTGEFGSGVPRLRTAVVVERNVGRTLQSAVYVPVGLAVSNQSNEGHSEP